LNTQSLGKACNFKHDRLQTLTENTVAEMDGIVLISLELHIPCLDTEIHVPKSWFFRTLSIFFLLQIYSASILSSFDETLDGALPPALFPF
jgi:hypothetical protein